MEVDISLVNRMFLHAINSLNLRCLSKSSKWLGEQLIGIDAGQLLANSINVPIAPRDDIDVTSAVDYNSILFAQSLISSGEFQRCSHFLQNSTTIMKDQMSRTE